MGRSRQGPPASRSRPSASSRNKGVPAKRASLERSMWTSLKLVRSGDIARQHAGIGRTRVAANHPQAHSGQRMHAETPGARRHGCARRRRARCPSGPVDPAIALRCPCSPVRCRGRARRIGAAGGLQLCSFWVPERDFTPPVAQKSIGANPGVRPPGAALNLLERFSNAISPVSSMIGVVVETLAQAAEMRVWIADRYKSPPRRTQGGLLALRVQSRRPRRWTKAGVSPC